MISDLETSFEKYLVWQFLFSAMIGGVPRQLIFPGLTEVAGEGGTDCPPQKFLSSQKFRHLMG